MLQLSAKRWQISSQGPPKGIEVEPAGSERPMAPAAPPKRRIAAQAPINASGPTQPVSLMHVGVQHHVGIRGPEWAQNFPGKDLLRGNMCIYLSMYIHR